MNKEEILKAFDENQEVVRVQNEIFGGKIDWSLLREIFEAVLDRTKAEVVIVTRPLVLIDENGVVVEDGEKIRPLPMLTRKCRGFMDRLDVIRDILLEFDKYKIVYFYQFCITPSLPDGEGKLLSDPAYLIRYRAVDANGEIV